MAEIASALFAGYSGALAKSKQAQKGWAGMRRPNPSFTSFPANDGLLFLLLDTHFLSGGFVRADVIGCALRTRGTVIVRRHAFSGDVHACVDGR